jgi:hypothetical protein
MAMMAITTRSSISVKPRLFWGFTEVLDIRIPPSNAQRQNDKDSHRHLLFPVAREETN